MRTPRLAALAALALLLAPAALAADPEPLPWSPYNATSGAVVAVALAAEGTTLAAALGPPVLAPNVGATPRVVLTDLAILDLGVGFAQNGTTYANPPLGRSHVAVSRDGTSVASLGIDTKAPPPPDPNSPPLPNPDDPNAPGAPSERALRLVHQRAPAGGNFSSGPARDSSAYLDGTAVALLVSDNGNRVAVATQEPGFLSIWAYHVTGSGLSLGARYRAEGNVSGLAGDGALTRLYAAATVPQGNGTRGAVLVLPFGQAAPTTSYADASAANTTMRSVAASRDGNLLAAGTAAGRLLVFDATGGVLGEPRVLPLSPDPVFPLVVSEDGQRVAAASGRNLTHADVSAGGLRAVWKAVTPSPATSLSYNRTGGLLAATVPGEGVVAYGEGGPEVVWRNAGAAVSVSLNAAGDVVAFGRNSLVVAMRIPRGLALEHAAGGDNGPLRLVKPGGNATWELVVRNTGAAPEMVVLHGPSEPSLRLYVDPAVAYVRPGESKRVTLVAEALPSFVGGRTFNLTALSVTSSARDDTTVRVGLQTQANVSLRLNETELTVTPGEPVTLLVGIQNNGTRDAAVGIRATQRVTAGAPWEVVLDPASLTLAPASRTTVRVVVTPPEDVANGTSLALTLSLEGQDVSDSATVTLRINPTVGLEVNALGRVRFIKPGEVGAYNVTVTNTGSLPGTFGAYYDLIPPEGATPRAWTVEMSTAPFELAPGASRTIPVGIRAPFDVTPADRVSVRVTAQLEALNDTGAPLLGNVTLFANGEAPVPTAGTGAGDSGIPGPAPLVLVAALACLALLRRRRA